MRRERARDREPARDSHKEFWIVHAQENPADPVGTPGRREWRSNMLAESLAGRGHKALRWRSSFSHQAKRQLVEGSPRQCAGSYDHQFLYGPPYRRHVGLARVRHHRSLGRSFTQVSGDYGAKPDLIHVGNVPIELMYAAVRFGVTHAVPVVVDIRDLWPDAYLDLIPDWARAIKPVARAGLRLASSRLNYSLRHATAITALTRSYLDWGLRRAGRAERSDDRVFAMCYPCLEDPSATTVAELRAKLGVAEDAVLGAYVGNIGFQSDFDTLIEAAAMLASSHPQFRLILAGSGPEAERLQGSARELPNVIFPGWLTGGEVQALLHISTFGMIAYREVDNFLLNIPNKFPEYLAGGLAVACGLHGEMGQLVQETGCGFLYTQGNAASLAEQLARSMADEHMLGAMGDAATRLHRDRFDGAKVYPAFCDYLEKMAGHVR